MDALGGVLFLHIFSIFFVPIVHLLCQSCIFFLFFWSFLLEYNGFARFTIDNITIVTQP
jgi:hypothetical protein